MKLSTARLCLDCDDVHDQQECPSCASESFAFLTRWVPGGQRPPGQAEPKVEPTDPERYEAYRALTDRTPPQRASRGAKVARTMLGLATLGLAGWVWSSSRAAAANRRPCSTSGRPEPEP